MYTRAFDIFCTQSASCQPENAQVRLPYATLGRCSPPETNEAVATAFAGSIHDNDRFLLASDGLFEVLTDEEVLADVAGTLREGGDAERQ